MNTPAHNFTPTTNHPPDPPKKAHGIDGNHGTDGTHGINEAGPSHQPAGFHPPGNSHPSQTSHNSHPSHSSQTSHPRHPVVLEITVRDHPGVMSHVCGLFARRAFNVDAILCLPLGDGRSRIWLRVDENGRTEQVEKQLRRLEDVIDIAHHAAGPEVFTRLREIFEAP